MFTRGFAISLSAYLLQGRMSCRSVKASLRRVASDLDNPGRLMLGQDQRGNKKRKYAPISIRYRGRQILRQHREHGLTAMLISGLHLFQVQGNLSRGTP